MSICISRASLKLDFIFFIFISRIVAFWIMSFHVDELVRTCYILFQVIGCILLTMTLGLSFDNSVGVIVIVRCVSNYYNHV